MLRRYPDGIKARPSSRRICREGVPDWLKRSIPSEGRKDVHYVIANDLASLLFLTGLGCIDHNPWSSRRDDLEHPDYFFFDLDPSEGTEFSRVLTLARALHEKLTKVGLKIFLKTSGATGFHIYLPVERVYTYEQLRMFGEIVAHLVTASIPTSSPTSASWPSAARAGPDRRHPKLARQASGRGLFRPRLSQSAGLHSRGDQ